jgi:hypothetical protein
MSMQKVYEASPSVQWFAALKTREHSRGQIVRMLKKRFGDVSEEIVTHLNAIDVQDRLDALHDVAMDCVDLNTFRAAMRETA